MEEVLKMFSSRLEYQQDSGALIWKATGKKIFDSRYAGKEAGNKRINTDGHKSIQLTVATLSNKSYQDVVGYPEGSLIFLDPPYVDSHTQYDRRKEFKVSMQQDVAEWTVEQAAKHQVMFCNKTHQMFTEIFKGFTIELFGVKYTASAQRTSDGSSELPTATEILVTNF